LDTFPVFVVLVAFVALDVFFVVFVGFAVFIDPALAVFAEPWPLP
jgi:hypothetical protein